MGKKVISILLFFAGLSLQAQTPVVLDVLAMEYPPYTSAAKGGSGLAVELLQEALGKDMQIKLNIYPPARVISNFLQGNSPAALLGSNFEKKGNFKEVAYFSVKLRLFYNNRRGQVEWTRLKDLAGKSVGLPRFPAENDPGVMSRTFQEAGLQVYSIDSLDQGFRMLAAGRIDLMLSEELAGKTAVAALSPAVSELVMTDRVFQTFPGSIWLNLDLPAARQVSEKLLPGLKALVRDGRAGRILSAYYGPAVRPEDVLIFP